MFKAIIAAIAAAGLAGSLILPASAQSLPGGSYRQSCSNARVYGNRLYADCTPPQGSAQRTSIALDSCTNGDIANVNGNLRCNGNRRGSYDDDDRARQQNRDNGDRYDRRHNDDDNQGNGRNRNYGNDGYQQNAAPGGSYLSSCTNVQTNGSRVTATCSAVNGRRITSSIDARRCDGSDIANINGRLDCR